MHRDEATRLLEASLPTLARTSMALLGDGHAVKAVLERMAEGAAAELSTAADEDAARLSLFTALRRLCAERLAATGPLRPEDAAPETARMGASADARKRLMRLKPTERDALVLKLVAGLETSEIASVCGVDESTVRSRLTNALAATSGEGER